MIQQFFAGLLIISLSAFSQNQPKISPERITMSANLIKEDDKVVIKNVNGWFVGEKESSPHAQQEIVMQALGDQHNYDYYIGISGLAFRMQISKEGFCPSSPHANCGYKCDRSSKLYPWKINSYSCKPEELEKANDIRKKIVESIDRGFPVLYGSEESGVIVGYQKDGEEFIAYHPFHEGGKSQFVEKGWPWGFEIFSKEKISLLDEKALFVESIKQAIEMSNAQDSGNYYVGLSAWEKIIQKLEELDSADDKTRQDAMMGNSWIYECLSSYRSSAAKYLRYFAPKFDEKPRAHLLKAAEYYDKMSKEALTGKECVLTIAPAPWSLKEGQKWTSDMRKEEIRRIKLAYELEKKAIEELKSSAKGI